MLCNHNHLTWLKWHRVQPSNAELSMCTHVIQFLMMVFLDAVEFIRHSSDSTPQSLATYIPDRFFNEPLAFGIDFPRFALIGADIYLITHTHALCGVPVKDPVNSEDDGKNSIPTENERLCLSFKIPNGTWISNREH